MTLSDALVLASVPDDPSIERRRPEEDVLLFLGERYHRLQKSRHELKQIALELTSRCDRRCRHCYMRATRKRPRGELSFAEVCGLGLQIRQDFGRRIDVAITGGEPMLRKDLPLILRYLRALGLPVSMSTHGGRIDRRSIRRIEEHLAAISVSLDGLDESHDSLRGEGAYRSALRGLRLAVDSAIPLVMAKTAVTRANLDELPELHRLLRRLGVDEWHVFPVEPWGRAVGMKGQLLSDAGYEALCDWFDAAKTDPSILVCFEEQNSFLRERRARDSARFKRCLAGIRRLAVLANGDVVPCVQGARAPEGNVRRERLRDIWKRGFATCRAKGWRTCGRHLREGG
ncbi:MAG: radical SAM protein [Planctomycetota bacterium]|jgi:MoaA/NifB/PqqE/SkfB family radical SAM enzyme